MVRAFKCITEFTKRKCNNHRIVTVTSVTLIIGNTIRLSIMDKKEEIQVMKLVGATNTFIHAPFLWTGIWYGVIGGLFAFICVG